MPMPGKPMPAWQLVKLAMLGWPAEVSGNAVACCNLAHLETSRAEHWHAQALRADLDCVAALVALADLRRRAECFAVAVHPQEAA